MKRLRVARLSGTVRSLRAVGRRPSCHREPPDMTRCLLQRSPPRPPTQRLTQKLSGSKNKTPSTAGGTEGSCGNSGGGGIPSALHPRHPPSPCPPAASDQGGQHISVIHSAGWAARKSPSVAAGTPGRETTSRPSGSSPKLVSPSSPHSSPPESYSICSSPKPLAVSLSSSSTPFSISSLTKPSTLFASPHPQHKPKVSTSTPPNHKEGVDGVTDGRRLLLSSFVMQVSLFFPPAAAVN